MCRSPTTVCITFQNPQCCDFLSITFLLLRLLILSEIWLVFAKKCRIVSTSRLFNEKNAKICQNIAQQHWSIGLGCVRSKLQNLIFLCRLCLATPTPTVCSSSIQAPDKRVACLLAHDKQYYTLFENYSKCRIWILAFSTKFCPIKTDLSGNTVWPKASGFQKLLKMDHFWHF